MQSLNSAMEADSAHYELKLDSLLDLLPSLDKFDGHSSIDLSDASTDGADMSDSGSISPLDDSDSDYALDEATRYASGMSPKAMKVLGVSAPANTKSSLPRRKPLSKILGDEFDRSREAMIRPNFAIPRARQLWFRTSQASTTSSDLSPVPSKESRKSSITTDYLSSSDRSSKISESPSPQERPSLAPYRQLSSTQRIRKFVHYLEDEASRANLNKPLPLAPKGSISSYRPSRASLVARNRSEPELSPTTTCELDGHGNAKFELSSDSELPNGPWTCPSRQSLLAKNIHLRKHVSQMMLSRPATLVDSPPDANAESVALRILLNFDNVDHLPAAAMINKSFYQAFRRHEALIVSRTILVSSPAAWELRQSANHQTRQSPFRLKSVRRDVTTLHALEAFIVMRCRAVCRPESIQALLGADLSRKFDLENALWRIWTFCKLFGKGSGVHTDFSSQVLWLNGGRHQVQGDSQTCFGIGNGSGLSMRDLEDMSEMWRCMECLLSGFHGREEGARRAGIFSSSDVTDTVTETKLLQAWIYDILSLGPKAVLTLSSCDFDQATVLGLTAWTPPKGGNGRQHFLRAAVEEVYRERLVADAQKVAEQFKTTNFNSRHQRSASDSEVILPAPVPHRLRPPITERRLKVDTKQQRSQSAPMPSNNVVGDSVRPDCDPSSPTAQNTPNTSSTLNAASFSSIGVNRQASTRLGSTLFPTTPTRTPQPAHVRKSRPPRESPIVDPTDKALHLLVNEMGFDEMAAKRALAKTDSGVGVDVDKAIELLTIKKQGTSQTPPVEMPAVQSPISPTMSRQNSQKSKEYCEGTCTPKTIMIAEPKRDRVQGLGFVRRNMSVKKGLRRMSTPLSVIPDDEDGKSLSQPQGTTSSKHSKSFPNRTKSVPNFNPAAAAMCTETFRGNGGGFRATIFGPVMRENGPPVAGVATRSTGDLLRPQLTTRLSTLEEAASPSSIYSEPESETNTWPSQPNASSACTFHKEVTGGQQSGNSSPVPAGARITLTRVGTGKSGKPWRIGSVQKRHSNGLRGSNRNSSSSETEQGEVIGYAL